MGRVGDPFSETSIQFAIDRDRIWRVRLALQRGNDAAIDPIMDDPEADAISLANLTNVQGSFGGLWSLNAMFVSQPFYRTRRNRPPCCGALVTFVAQQCDEPIYGISESNSPHRLGWGELMETWPSGLRRETYNLLRWLRTSWVRIPPSPGLHSGSPQGEPFSLAHLR